MCGRTARQFWGVILGVDDIHLHRRFARLGGAHGAVMPVEDQVFSVFAAHRYGLVFIAGDDGAGAIASIEPLEVHDRLRSARGRKRNPLDAGGARHDFRRRRIGQSERVAGGQAALIQRRGASRRRQLGPNLKREASGHLLGHDAELGRAHGIVGGGQAGVGVVDVLREPAGGVELFQQRLLDALGRLAEGVSRDLGGQHCLDLGLQRGVGLLA